MIRSTKDRFIYHANDLLENIQMSVEELAQTRPTIAIRAVMRLFPAVFHASVHLSTGADTVLDANYLLPIYEHLCSLPCCLPDFRHPFLHRGQERL